MSASLQLGEEIREIVLGQVKGDPQSRARLAHALRIPEPSVDRMMSAKVWDLKLALESAEALGLSLHVTRE